MTSADAFSPITISTLTDAFEGNPVDGSLNVIERKDAEREASAEDWFDRAIELEDADVDSAIGAYEHALTAKPTLLEAAINLGRLLHEARRYKQAERVYRGWIEANGNDPLLLFNFGVLLEDMDRKKEAKVAYEAALDGDPRLADCHYNLALLCEELDKPQEAIRHMAQYRRLKKS